MTLYKHCQDLAEEQGDAVSTSHGPIHFRLVSLWGIMTDKHNFKQVYIQLPKAKVELFCFAQICVFVRECVHLSVLLEKTSHKPVDKFE